MMTSSSEAMHSTSSLTETLSKVTDHVSEEDWELVLLINLLINVSFGVWHIFIDHSEHSLWNLLWLVNLKEGMLVSSSLLAHSAKVKVLADAALVSDSSDWTLVASITDDVLMNNLLFGVDLVFLSSKLLAFHHLIEDG